MLNLPNYLALFRIALAPLMFVFLVNRELFGNIHYAWLDFFAAYIFVVASITDFFDGFIARRLKQETNLGAILDPLADKMLMLAAFIGVMMLGRASEWAIFIILSREFFITGLRIAATNQNISVKASWSGKVKTVSQMVAIGFLLMNWWGAQILLWIAVFLTLYSGLEYSWEYYKKQGS